MEYLEFVIDVGLVLRLGELVQRVVDSGLVIGGFSSIRHCAMLEGRLGVVIDELDLVQYPERLVHVYAPAFYRLVFQQASPLQLRRRLPIGRVDRALRTRTKNLLLVVYVDFRKRPVFEQLIEFSSFTQPRCEILSI